MVLLRLPDRLRLEWPRDLRPLKVRLALSSELSDDMAMPSSEDTSGVALRGQGERLRNILLP